MFMVRKIIPSFRVARAATEDLKGRTTRISNVSANVLGRHAPIAPPGQEGWLCPERNNCEATIVGTAGVVVQIRKNNI
jgi:hypothetical protein